MGDDEIGVSFADFRVSDTGALESGFIDEKPGAHASGVFEDAAGGLETEGLQGFFGDPEGPHVAGDFVDILALESKGGLQHEEILEVRGAVGEGEFDSFAGDEFGLRIDAGDALTELPNFATFPAGISVECSADGAGDADEVFETGEPEFDGERDERGKLRSRSRGDGRFVDLFDFGEIFSDETDDCSADAFVADEEVGATAEDAGGDPLGSATLEDGDELSLIAWFDEVLSGTADLHPGVGSEWDVLREDVLKFIECCHAESG